MTSSRLLRMVLNPLGSRELAAVQENPGHTPFFRRSAFCWFKTWKMVLGLTGVLVVAGWVSPSLHAGIIFTAGTETVGPGGSVSVPITVSSSLTPPSVNWLNAGFNLT